LVELPDNAALNGPSLLLTVDVAVRSSSSADGIVYVAYTGTESGFNGRQPILCPLVHSASWRVLVVIRYPYCIGLRRYALRFEYCCHRNIAGKTIGCMGGMIQVKNRALAAAILHSLYAAKMTPLMDMLCCECSTTCSISYRRVALVALHTAFASGR